MSMGKLALPLSAVRCHGHRRDVPANLPLPTPCCLLQVGKLSLPLSGCSTKESLLPHLENTRELTLLIWEEGSHPTPHLGKMGELALSA